MTAEELQVHARRYHPDAIIESQPIRCYSAASGALSQAHCVGMYIRKKDFEAMVFEVHSQDPAYALRLAELALDDLLAGRLAKANDGSSLGAGGAGSSQGRAYDGSAMTRAGGRAGSAS